MNLKQKRKCPICFSDKFELIYANNFCSLDNLDLSYYVCNCLHCGFVSANYIPEFVIYEEYYSRYSKYDIYDSEDKIPQIDQEIANLTLDFIRSNGILFRCVYDIGCSIGLLLSKLKANYDLFRCEGIDPAPHSKTIAKELFGLDIKTGFFDGSDRLDDYDLIIASSVLEHVIDVSKFINNISINVREGTFLLLVVPSLNDFPVTQGEWLGELSLEHINFFNEF